MGGAVPRVAPGYRGTVARITGHVRIAAPAEQVRIPDRIRHREKSRLALEMLDEMAGPGGWGVLKQVTAAGGTRPVVTADAGYGDNTTFRLELEDRRWQYVLAVKGTTSAHAPPPATVTRGDHEAPRNHALGGRPGRGRSRPRRGHRGRRPGPGQPGVGRRRRNQVQQRLAREAACAASRAAARWRGTGVDGTCKCHPPSAVPGGGPGGMCSA